MRALGGVMSNKVMIQKRIPKFFHSDGNGIHLEINKSYYIEKEGILQRIKVLEEYQNYYLVRVNGRYKSTVNKFINDFYILYDWELEELALFLWPKRGWSMIKINYLEENYNKL